LPVHGAAFMIESDSYNHLQYHEDGALTSSRHDTASPDSDASVRVFLSLTVWSSTLWPCVCPREIDGIGAVDACVSRGEVEGCVYRV